MSGVVGLFSLDGRPPVSAVRAGMEALAHRGRHGQALWDDGPMALGRLQTYSTPESLFEAPLETLGSGPLVLVADVRLDNQADLIRELGMRRASDHPITAPEVVLAAYRKWGRDCPAHLLGDFALAIWDGEAGELLLARDHFGVRPLFFAYRPGVAFAFASEPKALFAMGAAGDALDEAAVAELLLVPVADDAARTIHRDVRALAPASTAVVRPSGVDVRTYWALDPDREVRLGSDGAYADAFSELFEESVRCRMRSATPVGAMLSGGLDSSSIACVASRFAKGRLHTYSAVFPDAPESDESQYIDAVVAHTGAVAHRFAASSVGPLTALDEMLHLIDKPAVAGNLYLNHTLYSAASQSGMGVILDGFDGDTTVSHGLGRLTELRAAGRYGELTREVRALARALGEPPLQTTWSWIRGPVLRGTGLVHLRRAGRWAARSLAPRPTAAPALISSALTDLAAPPSPRPTTEREHHASLLRRPLMARTNELLDATAAGVGIEVRLPFYDRRLVEFCLALPPDQKLRSGRSRFVMQQAMRGTLPEAVLNRRRKASLEPSHQHGLYTFERDRIRSAAADLGPAARYLDPDVFRTQAAAFLDSPPGTAYLPNEFWRAFSLALWMRSRADASPAFHTNNGALSLAPTPVAA